jgi:hypothetical protein
VPRRAAEILLLAGPSDRSAKNVRAWFVGLIVKQSDHFTIGTKIVQVPAGALLVAFCAAIEEAPLEAQWK